MCGRANSTGIRPGSPAELLRENTGEGNGTTFDPQGRLVICEGGNRRLTRWPADGKFASSEVLIDRFEGKRLSRPNDVVCKSDGSIYFTNPGLRIPLAERELDPSAIYRVKPDGSASHVADFEYPNGLAFSPDERVLYVANTQAGDVHPPRSSSTAPATWCGGGSSPTCRRTRRSACPTA